MLIFITEKLKEYIAREDWVERMYNMVHHTYEVDTHQFRTFSSNRYVACVGAGSFNIPLDCFITEGTKVYLKRDFKEKTQRAVDNREIRRQLYTEEMLSLKGEFLEVNMIEVTSSVNIYFRENEVSCLVWCRHPVTRANYMFRAHDLVCVSNKHLYKYC